MMKTRNACGFGAGSMKVLGGASIAACLLVVLSTFAAAQTVPQNTTGRNPGTQVPPGPYIPDEPTAAEQTRTHNRSQIGVAGISSNSFKFMPSPSATSTTKAARRTTASAHGGGASGVRVLGSKRETGSSTLAARASSNFDSPITSFWPTPPTHIKPPSSV
jgi:hypothetical protein